MFLARNDQINEFGEPIGDYIREASPNATIIVFMSQAEARQFGTPIPLAKYVKPRIRKTHLDHSGMTLCNRYSAWRSEKVAEVNCKDCLAELKRKEEEGVV